MAKRFQLGVMDLYPLAVIGTSVEDSPMVGVALDEDIDGERIKNALCKAVELFPLFKTKIIFDKGYYLEENNNPILVFNENDYNKTFTWKSGMNDYPWKLSYYKNKIYFRWCHAITDGRGVKSFIEALLHFYYDLPYSIEPELELGLEPFADKSEKGIKQKKQPNGFGTKGLKIAPSDKFVQSHILKCKTADILALAKRSDASPATVIPPLFSMALRKCMKKKMNVKFSVVVDARGPLGHKTMHNCIYTKGITYIDRFDSMDFELVSTIYRAILNLGCERENAVVEATNSIKLIGTVVNRKSKWLIRLGGKVCAKFMKSTDSDATFSYIGKVDFGAEVNKHIRDCSFAAWTDFGYCNIVAADFNGIFTMYINESYADKRVIPEFINIAKELGLEIKETDSYKYYRADVKN